MKVLVTGTNGQLSYELQQTCPTHVILIATNAQTLDITQQEQITAALDSYLPDVIINAAAYTAVDKAETDIENATAINT